MIEEQEGGYELDSHANTTLVGSNMIFLDNLLQADKSDVYGFSDKLGPIRIIHIGTCATAYDCLTGQLYILLFGQCLYFGNEVPSSLLCPNQLRAFGTRVKDCPTMYESKSDHSLTFHEQETGDSLFIPLKIDGTVSYIPSKKPSQ